MSAIEEMEKAEPVAWLNKKLPHMAVITKPDEGGGWFPVFTHPAPIPESCEDEGCPYYGTPHSHGKLPEGWQLVPVEPTESMLNALKDGFYGDINEDDKAFTVFDAIRAEYKAMLAAAPKPEYE